MAARQRNIDLIITPKDVIAPSCPHGPTLLFERFDQSSLRMRRFFACSAFRDNRECSFHKWYDDIKQIPQSRMKDSYSHKKLRLRFRKFRKLPKVERCVCCTCGLLLLPAEIQDHAERGHSIKTKVTLKDLKHPSLLFKPLDNNKTYAQYLFSSKAVDFLISTIKDLEYTHVLCVGAPRIHERIQSQRKNGDTSLSSMLLDLDDRYAQLNPLSQFSKYNMFNHHFFEDHGETYLQKFLESGADRILLFTDPPFGGMVEALAQSFLKLSLMWRRVALREDERQTESVKADTVMPLFWIFPYFFEDRIVSHLPTLVMLDYKVDYDNHNLFNNQHKKKGSPVRIFTNIPAAKIVLPQDEGYWFCDLCQRYSSQENQHCKDCGTCPSKDGTTYAHCDACLRCVKPSRVHCFKCKMCVLQDHQCGKVLSSGCHICGEEGHKRRECPQRNQKTEILNKSKSLKRKIQEDGLYNKEKRRSKKKKRKFDSVK